MAIKKIFERLLFVIMAVCCAVNVEVGNYGVAVFTGFLALDMTTSNA